MEQSSINNDNLLFTEDEFDSLVNGILFSNKLEVEDDFLQSLFPISDVHHEQYLNTDENPLSALQYLTEAENNSHASFEGEQPMENSDMHQNSDVIINTNPQQASGNQDGIMYKMYPSLSDYIIGDMTVNQQPKANNRLRYESDGSRFLPGSRYHPMSINLPDLRSLLLQNNQKWGIVMTLITDTLGQAYVHANDLIYRIDGAKKIGHGCVFVPLEPEITEIPNSVKPFPRCSIIYKKCDEYTFDLTPFHPSYMFGTTEKYSQKNMRNSGNAALGKKFKEDYNLLSYKINFQLALEENNVIYISNTSCQTEPVDEKIAAKPSSNKRSASSSIESLSEDNNTSDTQISTSTKKFKSSSITGLPVTHVSQMINNNPC